MNIRTFERYDGMTRWRTTPQGGIEVAAAGGEWQESWLFTSFEQITAMLSTGIVRETTHDKAMDEAHDVMCQCSPG